jgi:hypothetical protein
LPKTNAKLESRPLRNRSGPRSLEKNVELRKLRRRGQLQLVIYFLKSTKPCLRLRLMRTRKHNLQLTLSSKQGKVSYPTTQKRRFLKRNLKSKLLMRRAQGALMSVSLLWGKRSTMKRGHSHVSSAREGSSSVQPWVVTSARHIQVWVKLTSTRSEWGKHDSWRETCTRMRLVYLSSDQSRMSVTSIVTQSNG